ncbi:hypothetical protein ACQKLP_10670 [Chitinophaga sp. NPDC101104]|uniref:hypothetical protein n=1 Tax=Chitinophaga sp. NPDC101104 TaxID=3390561 RepID=UPI003D01AD72
MATDGITRILHALAQKGYFKNDYLDQAFTENYLRERDLQFRTSSLSGSVDTWNSFSVGNENGGVSHNFGVQLIFNESYPQSEISLDTIHFTLADGKSQAWKVRDLSCIPECQEMETFLNNYAKKGIHKTSQKMNQRSYVKANPQNYFSKYSKMR